MAMVGMLKFMGCSFKETYRSHINDFVNVGKMYQDHFAFGISGGGLRKKFLGIFHISTPPHVFPRPFKVTWGGGGNRNIPKRNFDGFCSRKHRVGVIHDSDRIWQNHMNHMQRSRWPQKDPHEQPPLFGKERNSLWMETFFFQIHRAYGNEVGGNPKTR